MQPELVEIVAFTVHGIRVRTVNRDEADPNKAKLPGLWGTFYSQGIAGKIPGRLPGSPIFGVYSSYESDASGPYDLTAGVAVQRDARSSVSGANAASEFAAVDVEAGEYVVFAAKGPMPRIVIDTWGAVWKFFEHDRRYKRKFTTDFERYSGGDEVAIHIAVSR